MKYTIEKTRLMKKEQLAENVYRFSVFSPVCSSIAKPGQFANISVLGKTLRRPISICDIDAESGLLRFVFEVRGDGTKILAQYREGDDVDILAPLGRGFDVSDTSKRAVFIGGGIGVPPLLAASKAFGSNATALLGFRNKSAVILEADFAKNGASVQIATDDGSFGYHGFVTELLKAKLDENDTDIIYACGPMPMLRIISDIAQSKNIPCQVSLEERMGCGIGACLVCACGIKNGDETKYRHVCKDGPVFDSKEVDWDA